MSISNSTFYHNGATNGGGAVFNTGSMFPGTLTISNSTFSGNLAALGGSEITVDGGAVNLFSSIVAGDATSYNRTAYIYGSVNLLGYNLIADGEKTVLIGYGNDQVGTRANLLNPNLDLLQNNGGSTQTMAIQSTSSLAYGKGNCGGILSGPVAIPAVTTDQRGVPRKTPNCDVGAYELNPNALTPSLITGN